MGLDGRARPGERSGAMTLFENPEASACELAMRLVERSIAELGVSPVATRLHDASSGADAGGTWSFKRGSADVLVTVSPPQGGHAGAIRVISPVVRLPEDEAVCARLFRHLLTLNGMQVVGAAFGLIEEEVVVVAERSVVDLDPSEVDEMLRAVGEVADYFDEVLAGEYGGVPSSDTSE